MKYFALLFVFLAACAPLTAQSTIEDIDGELLAKAHLMQTKEGVKITLTNVALPPGEHAFHIHEKASCKERFMAAGAHFNPTMKEHGHLNPKGPHAGDLPNVIVTEEGGLELDPEGPHADAYPQTAFNEVHMFAPDVTLGQGIHSLFKYEGTSFIIHEGKDDYSTDPTGEAGGRLGCGLIVR